MFGINFGTNDSQPQSGFDWLKLLAGAAGGIAGTLAMRSYWSGATMLHGKDPREETRPRRGDIQPIDVLESQNRERERRNRQGAPAYYPAGGATSTGSGLRTLGFSDPSVEGSRPKKHVPPVSEEGWEDAKRERQPDALPILRPKQRYRRKESSTAAAGRLIYEKITGREPSKETKQRLSQALHWGTGLESGISYAISRASPHRRGLDIAGGLSLGAFLWAVGDELAIPALGLAGGPQKYPLKQHVHRLGAHLTFGAATAAVTQIVYRLLGGRN